MYTLSPKFEIIKKKPKKKESKEKYSHTNSKMMTYTKLQLMIWTRQGQK